MIEQRDILVGVILPGVVALLVLLVGWRPWQRAYPVEEGEWAGPLAIGLAFAAAYAGLQQYFLMPGVDPVDAEALPWPTFPLPDAKLWLMVLAVPVAIVAGVDSIVRRRVWVSLIVAIAATGMFKLLLPRQPWYVPMVIAGLVWVVGFAADVVAERMRGVAVPVVLWLTAVGAAMVLVDGSSQKLGQYAGALAAAAGAAGVVALLAADGAPLARGGVYAFVTILAGLLAAGHFYGDVTRFTAIAILVAPAFAWAGELPGVNKIGPRKRSLISVVAALAWVAFAAGPATMRVIELAKSQSAQPAGYYGY